MQETRRQKGGVNLDISSSGKRVWVFRWRETRLDGSRVQRKRVIGTIGQYRTKASAEKAARAFRLALLDRADVGLMQITVKELVHHYRENELVDQGEHGKAYSTRHRCESVLDSWILPRWEKLSLEQVRTVDVENWLRSIPRSNGTKAKIRNTMSALFNHAIRWQLTDRNPITGPVRGSGVRQSSKRAEIPDLLEVEEFKNLQARLGVRERILVWLGMTCGLRRGELAGLRWEDIDFKNLSISARRSVVDQVVGPVKTEASKKPIPIADCIAEDLLGWYRTTKYHRPGDYVFSTDAKRAGKKRGQQPVWLSKLMQYQIQPAAKQVGIRKKIGWHTFRRTYTSLLHANGEDVKVVQELLRHGSARVTLDVYAQAVTEEKRKAQARVVSILRSSDDKAS